MRLASGGGFLLLDSDELLGVLGVEIAGGRITAFNLVPAPGNLKRSSPG